MYSATKIWKNLFTFLELESGCLLKRPTRYLKFIVHILWEGPKNSQNIWTLTCNLSCSFFINWTLFESSRTNEFFSWFKPISSNVEWVFYFMNSFFYRPNAFFLKLSFRNQQERLNQFHHMPESNTHKLT